MGLERRALGLQPTAGTRIVLTAFRASGPYQPSPGLVTAVVECWGGGGGGGSVTWLAATIGEGGGGGGSGGYSKKTLAAALVLGGVAVTVAGQAAPGANGTVTSFGAFCVANGGSGRAGSPGIRASRGSPASATWRSQARRAQEGLGRTRTTRLRLRSR